MMKPGYQDRVVRQMMLWVNGKPTHNHIDNECCADFSCCVPRCFTDDLHKRIKRMDRLMRDYGRNDHI
jgi:hypothetical protein